jgi:hypothetical protein
MTIIDITYQTNIGERHGRRRMYDNHTGEMWWEPEEPVVPEGYFDGPPNPPNPPRGYNVEADVLTAPTPVNPAPKPRAKKRLLHG